MLRSLDGEGVERPALLDRVDMRLGHLARRKGPVAHAVADRGDAEVGEVGHRPLPVIPANAGIQADSAQSPTPVWTPAFAGVTAVSPIIRSPSAPRRSRAPAPARC